MEVKIVKKAALICAMVLIVSIVPAFALNQTTNNTTAQVQTQSGTSDQTQSHDKTVIKPEHIAMTKTRNVRKLAQLLSVQHVTETSTSTSTV